MSEVLENLQESVEYQKQFEEKYPSFWKMVSYYSWKEENPRFEYVKDGLEFSFHCNRTTKQATSCQITIIDSKLYEEFAKNPIEFLQKKLFTTPIVVNNDKAILDFAQDTILKAIKGA